MLHATLQISFWSSLVLLVFTFLGYPALMGFLARLQERDSSPIESRQSPPVTVVLAAHNEESRIVARLENLLASDCKNLSVIVVSDGSTDDTAGRVQSFSRSNIRLIIEPQRRGKAHALNLAMAMADDEIIVFADVRQKFAPDAIRQLVRCFNDFQTGAVSGELLVESAQSAVGEGVDAYWKLEKFIRLAEARWDSSIGCTGAIYAIRRQLFRPIPADTILDDVVIPMQVAERGFRVGFEPAARAFDPQTLDPEREQIRKRRTLAGNFQMLFRHPHWLLPWKNRLWWQLVSHKYLRLAAPFLLSLAFVANLLLLAQPFYRLWFGGQCVFYGLAIAGLYLKNRLNPLLSIPAGFVFLNWLVMDGLRQYLRGTYRQGQWSR